jgi:hypothetical protein
MLYRVLEVCLMLIFLVLTVKEIIIPVFTNKPLFPLVTRMLKGDGRKKLGDE